LAPLLRRRFVRLQAVRRAAKGEMFLLQDGRASCGELFAAPAGQVSMP
jgi:hypothetical protein